MCGIAGWIDWERDLTRQGEAVGAMVKTLSYRGPDAEGMWLSEHAALAHRRLVVVDPVGGGQPMTRRYGHRVYAVTYNGELYNTVELRRELEARGHKMLTRNSDTEALLLAYIEWGPECVHRFNGIFAFAIWDEAEQRLFMARDRLGVKPLFYANRGNWFLFGSELKALLAHPEIKPEVGMEGLAEIFFMGPARTPGQGVFSGISEVRPGQCLVYDRNGCRLNWYWSLESRPHEDDLPTTVATVYELLKDTVERQLVADVPVSCFLSGGLDSSAISAFAAAALDRNYSGPLQTYSVDYVDNEQNFRATRFQPNNDAPWIKRMAEFLGTVHHHVEIDTPELVEALKQSLRANDLPGMADVDSSLYLFCRELKKDVTVALSGESADEVFGGYPWFNSEEAAGVRTFPWIRMVEERAALLSGELVDLIRPEEYLAERYREALAEVPRLPGENSREESLRELFYLNITRFMPTLLDRKDRMSMAVGLEVRVPFCDHRLVDYVWNIPGEMKFCDGREKGILRRALAGVLPEDVLARRKSPYPKTHNPTYLKAARRWLENILEDRRSPLLQLINVDAVRDALRTGGAAFNPAWFGQLMGGAQLFAYLALVDTWLREYRVEIR